MNRLFIVADEDAVEYAIRFARSCSSGLNLFALANREGSIREAVRDTSPDIAILVGTDDAERAARHVREVSAEAPSAVVLVLTPQSEGEVLDEVCQAAATVCATVASKHRRSDGVNGEPTGTPSDARVNGTAPAPATASTSRDHANGHHTAREPEPTAWRLTPREVDVLCAAAEGASNAQIGRQLWVTEQTVKFHLSNIYRKLGVSNRTEAMRRAIARGLVSMPGSVRDPGAGRTAVMTP
jgi:DNA-binding NarL/FixJ family response regulator